MTLTYDIYPLVMQVVNRIGQGQTLTWACDEVNLDVGIFKRFVAQDALVQEMYDEAVQRGYDAMADALVNIDNHRTMGRSDPKMAAVISKNIQWLLEKRKPREYGAKVEVTHNVNLDVTITSALARAKNRVPVSEVIDAEVVPPPVAALPYYDMSAEDAAILRDLLA